MPNSEIELAIAEIQNYCDTDFDWEALPSRESFIIALLSMQAQIKPDCEDNPIVKNVLEWCEFAIKNERSKRCKDFARHLIDVINAMADDSPSCGRELKGGE